VTPWTLIAVAVLGAGCEQLKSPQRISELEGRFDALSKEVARLREKAATAGPDGHDGSGSAAATPGAAGAGSGSGSAAGPEARSTGEPPGPQDGSGHVATAEPTAADAGTPDGGKQDDTQRDDTKRDDAAMDHLLAVVSKNTTTPRPGEPAGKPDAVHWAYDGKTGPPTWGTLDPAWRACLTGKAQSPIDIEPRAGSATPIVFHYKATAATIVDNGHTLQVNLAPGSSIEIDDVPYDLLQLHFHTPSEHTIAGEHYPLEVHLVHKDGAGKLAVIGVLYDVGAESKVLAGLWSAWPQNLDVEDKLKKPFDPSALLPETRTVFRYTGSLTTPPCTEGVLWNVMRRTPSDTRPHLEAFGLHEKRNARGVQPLGDRKIQ
jgi:carbonic anhydrase